MNKTILSVIITTSVALILAGVFFSTYYISMDKSLNSYEKNMKQLVLRINTLNQSTKDLLKESVIDTEAVKKNMPGILKQLDSIKEAVDVEIPGDKFKLQHTHIVEGIKLNKLMYMQINSILQNTGSKDLKDSFADFEKYRDDCENYYSQFSLGTVSPSVLTEAHDFLNIFKFYANQLIDTQLKADLKSKEVFGFVENIGGTADKFIPLKTDFSIELKNVRDKSSSYETLLALASAYKEQNNALEKSVNDYFKNITSAVSLCKPLKDNFVKLSKDYDAYIQSFITAVSTEKSEAEASEEPITEERLSQIYFDSKNRFLGIQDKYDNFLKQYTDFRTTNIK